MRFFSPGTAVRSLQLSFSERVAKARTRFVVSESLLDASLSSCFNKTLIRIKNGHFNMVPTGNQEILGSSGKTVAVGLGVWDFCKVVWLRFCSFRHGV